MAIPASRTFLFGLPWYSVLIVTGMILAVFLAEKEEKRLGLEQDTVIDLALIVIPLGIIGARLYYVAMTWDLFKDDLWSIFKIWEGGIAIYGGVIGGALGAFVYARKKKISFLTLADMIAPGLLLAQAIGRWGNYFNMEAYGPVIENAMFQFFPFGVLIPQGGEYVWHMATFFYESLWDLCGFAVLWLMRKKVTKPGSLFCWYLLIYGSGRFMIEQLREDSLYLGGFRVSQYLSLVFCLLAAVVLLLRVSDRSRKRQVLSILCAVLWILRWALLNTVVWYAVVSAAGCLSALVLLGKEKQTGALWLLTAAAVMDCAGLLSFAFHWPFSSGFTAHLHMLLCSVTLPMLVAALCSHIPHTKAEQEAN